MRRILMLIVLMICVVQVFAQTRTVTGLVTSKEDGQTIPGVNVSVKGTTTGTVTDLKGYYSIKVDTTSTLVFTFVGYQTVEIRVGDQEEINLAMEAETKAIDELVVIGYGTQKKSHLTGSVSKFKDERLDETASSRLDQALQGKIAGVQIQNTTSEVGVAPIVRIRGMGSISANSSPLIVVDGHPVDDGLSYVNMADVESIEVLKDASSSAIYGSRGANGVIIITTKSGAPDKSKYTFKTIYGVRSAYALHDIMPWSDYIRLQYKELALRMTDPNAPVVTIPDGDKAGYIIEQTLRNGQSTNWQEQAIRKIAPTRNFQLSVSGGKKDLTYYISGNIQNDEGQMYHSTYDKMSLVAKIGGNLSRRFKFNVNINPSYSKTERPSENYTDFIRYGSVTCKT
jgi:TonB-linked SusC/RagA family outer membrane protein